MLLNHLSRNQIQIKAQSLLIMLNKDKGPSSCLNMSQTRISVKALISNMQIFFYKSEISYFNIPYY